MNDKTNKAPLWSYKKIFALWLSGLGALFIISIVAQLRTAGAQQYARNDANGIRVTASEYGSAWPYFLLFFNKIPKVKILREGKNKI